MSGPTSALRCILRDVDAERNRLLDECRGDTHDLAPLDSLESEMILSIEVISRHTLDSARQLNPDYWSPLSDPDARSWKRVEIEERLEDLGDLSDQASRLTLPAISCYLKRLCFEIQYALGSSEAIVILNDLEQRYKVNRDILGQANVAIMRGDMHASSPFTNIICLNLNLADYWNVSSFNSDADDTSLRCNLPAWGTKLPDGPVLLENLSQGAHTASTYYYKARDLYARSTVVGGVSFALLKEACLLNCLSRRFELVIGKGSSYTEISRTLTEVLKQTEFVNDEMQHHLALTQKLTFHTETEFHPQRCEKISCWATTRQNDTFGLYLSILLRRDGDFCQYMNSAPLSDRLYNLASLILPKDEYSVLPYMHDIDARITSESGRGDVRYHKVHLDEYFSLLKQLEDMKNGMEEGGKAAKLKAIHQHFLRSGIDKFILIYSAAGNHWDWNAMLEPYLQKVSIDTDEPGQIAWHSQLLKDIKFQAARSTILNNIQDGDAKGASDTCQESILSLSADAHSLSDFLGQVDLLLICGKKELARETLLRIEVASFSETSPNASLQGYITSESQPYNTFLSHESMFSRCIKAEAWVLAKKSLRNMQKTQPAYFHGPGRWSLARPFQRLFWLGLLQEADGNIQSALNAFDQAIDALVRDLSMNAEFEQQKAVVDDPEAQQLLHSYVLATIRHSDRLGDRDAASKSVMESIVRLEHIKTLPLLHRMQKLERMSSSDRTSWMNAEYRLRASWELTFICGERDEHEDLEAIEHAPLGGLNNERSPEARHMNILHSRTALPKQRSASELLGVIPERSVVIYVVSTATDTATVFFMPSGLIAAHDDIPDEVLRNGIGPLVQLLGLDAGWLRRAEHIIFVPSGDFGLCPLGIPFHFLSDINVPVYQVPSLSVLLATQTHSKHMKAKIGGTCEDETSQDPTKIRISAIAKVGSEKEAMVTGEPMLPMAGIEAAMIAHLTENQAINGNDLDRNKFCKVYGESDIVHVCCHGYSNAMTPLRSYLSLKERVRLTDFLDAPSQASLAVFSACFSGMGKSIYGEDTSGLSTTVLATGVRAFIGSLWEVDDLATLFLMYFFYERLGQLRGRTIAQVWYEATKTLRTMTVSEADKLLVHFLEVWDQDKKNLKKIMKNGKKWIERARENMAKLAEKCVECPFSHPYFWAAFSLVGDGAQVLVPN
ncbi:hypothetical protein E8E14_014337 [Neopestalotiopsis sp. 37M]|nr:hypothetical protein E8E14_014337 [Neopestalotiopsis sp. 37M]